MMLVFFIGIGLCSILTGLASSPMQIAVGLFFIGVFAAIYHPVGLAIATTHWDNFAMKIAQNGVWGNLGVASAALITGYLIDHSHWRAAFILPGLFSIVIGFCYLKIRWQSIITGKTLVKNVSSVPQSNNENELSRGILLRATLIVLITTAASSIIFQATTFALPKMFDELLDSFVIDLARLLGLDSSNAVASLVGALVFITFAVASMSQLVVGMMLERLPARNVFMLTSSTQLVCFALMPSLSGGVILIAALGFMIGAFGQIPINDYLIGKMASSGSRGQVYGLRYVLSYSVLAATLPLVSFVYANWGFSVLFHLMAGLAGMILFAVQFLPTQERITRQQSVTQV